MKAATRLGIALAALTILFGCGAPKAGLVGDPPPKAPTDIVLGCCDRSDIYSDWVIGLADDNADIIRRVGGLRVRPGRLVRHEQAQPLILDALRPLDIVFMNSKNRVSGLLIPGQFTHGAIYIGTEEQLRAQGLWSIPALAPWRDRIASGAVFLEAVDGGVRLVPATTILDTDALLALRPRGIDRSGALRRGIGSIGVSFDMRFDASDPAELFCAELIDLMFPEIALPRVSVSGRETILIDAVVAGALSGDLAFGMVGYVKATPRGGLRVLSQQELAWDVRRAWPHTSELSEP
jgi:hypothetical protein